MAKLTYIQNQPRIKGVIVASLFKVEKVNGFSLKFQSKRRNESGELEDMEGKKLMEVNFGDSMLCVPNSRKRTGINPKTQKEYRDPEYIVYAYPEEKETSNKGKEKE